VYAQPLVFNGKLFAVTEANWIYSLDAVTGEQSWSRNLGQSFNPSEVACADLTPEIGITGTPVIDDTTGTAYLFAKSYVSGTSGPAQFQMHAIDLATGNDRAGFPVTIRGPAQNQSGQVFNPRTQAQRPGLLLMNGVVYAGFGGHCDFPPYQGWVVGVSTSGQIKAMWTTRSGTATAGGGLWMAGGGLMSDRDGSLFFSTGNSINGGSPDTIIPSNQPPADLGQSVVRLDVQADGTLQAADFFTPFDAPMLDLADVDLSSGGVIGLPSQFFGTSATPNLAAAAGKGGVLYLMNRDLLGGCRNGAGGMDAVVSRIAPVGGTWSRPALWPGDGGWLYLTINTGELGYYQYGITGDQRPTFSHQGAAAGQFGFGSSPPLITSNGTSSGSALLWVVWQQTGSGADAELRAYDAVPQGPTTQFGLVPTLRFSAPIGTAVKFNPPGIANGRVYVGTRDGHVLGFGSPTSTIVTGTSLAFANTVVGQSKTLNEVLQASGPVTITAINSSGAPFTIAAVTLPVTLAAGQQLSVPVTFAPPAAGGASGTLSISTSAGLLQENLSGLGLDQGPELTLTPGAIPFGNAAVGQTLTAPLKLTNTGTAALTITSSQQPAAPFSVTGLPANGATIASGQSIAATASFSPAATGSFNGQFSIISSGGTRTVSLTGSATIPGVLTVTPISLSFGDVDIGAAATASFAVSNTGGSPITITRSKPPVQGTFLRATNLDEGTVIAPGVTLTETVRFAPTAAGSFSDLWSLNSDVGTVPINVGITGTGVATGLTAVPDPIAGGWQLNASAQLLGDFSGALLQLTGTTEQFAAGTAFWPTPLPSANLNASFDATIGGGTGADGLTLMLADPTTAPTKVGVFGGQLGFGGISGTAVVLDTFQNGPANVVGISDGIGSDGNVHYLCKMTDAPPLRGSSHHVSVSYSGGVLSVLIDGNAACSAAVALPSNVLIGFTAGSGGNTDQHAVGNVSISGGAVNVPAKVVLSQPADGANVAGLFTISAQAAALAVSPLQSFSLSIDGAQVATGTSASLSFAWDTTVLATGSSHLITATAIDTHGNTGTASAHVTVKNPVVVQVTAPSANAVVAGDTVLTATAVPPLGLTVQSVALQVDGTTVATANAAPFSGHWNSTLVSNGAHDVTAVATDSSGGIVTSAKVAVVVRNPPQAVFASPLNGALVAGTVGISATANAPAGASLSSLVLRIDGASVAVSNGQPVSFAWDTTALDNGSSHGLELDAADGDGATSSATITVTIANPPVVTIDAVAGVSGLVPLSAAATAARGTSLAQITLLIDGAPAAAGAASPLTFSWDAGALANGSIHALSAQAVDADGISADAVPVTLTVLNQPVISFAAPSDGSEVSSVVALSATGVAPAGTTITTAELLIDGQQVAAADGATVSFAWDTTALANGSQHAVSARVVDQDGTAATAAGPTLRVRNLFAVALNPAGLLLTAGGGPLQVAIATTAAGGESIALTAPGLPAGITATFDATSIAAGASTAVTLQASGSASPGPFPFSVTGASATQSTASPAVIITVNAAVVAPPATGKSGGCGTGENAAPLLALLALATFARRRRMA
jgi:hypothetical protein